DDRRATDGRRVCQPCRARAAARHDDRRLVHPGLDQAPVLGDRRRRPAAHASSVALAMCTGWSALRREVARLAVRGGRPALLSRARPRAAACLCGRRGGFAELAPSELANAVTSRAWPAIATKARR